jgi:hypothetical protein
MSTSVDGGDKRASTSVCRRPDGKSSQAGLVKNREMKRPWRDARAFHRLRLEDEDDEGDQAVMMIATIMIDSVNIFVCYGRP